MTAIGASLCLIISFRSQTLWGVVSRLIKGAQGGRAKLNQKGAQRHAFARATPPPMQLDLYIA